MPSSTTHAARVQSPVTAAGSGPLGVVMATATDLLTSVDDGVTWSQAPLAPGFAGSSVTLLAQSPDGRLLAGTLQPADRRLGMWLGLPGA